MMIGLFDEAVDGGLQIDDGPEHAAFEPAPSKLAKKPSTASSHDAEVGVKWRTKRGCRASHAITFGCLWVA
jgi:hypothetical protein